MTEKKNMASKLLSTSENRKLSKFFGSKVQIVSLAVAQLLTAQSRFYIMGSHQKFSLLRDYSKRFMSFFEQISRFCSNDSLGAMRKRVKNYWLNYWHTCAE